MAGFLEKINGFVWGWGLIALLLGTGLILTVKLRFIQLRLPFLLRKNSGQNGGLSQLKTVCMSLGTTMGTGNITGAAAALALGGAGSVFWMWVSAFLGMALVYGENVLGAKFGGHELKGPMAYLEKGLGCPVLGRIFAFFCVMASFGMGGMVQVSAFSDAVKKCAHINGALLGLVSFAVIFAVIRGGAQRIGTAAQLLLPLASIAYAAVCMGVIFICRERLPQTIHLIFSEAFDFKSAAGGGIGYAVSVGIRRGIFSNEAGLGSSAVLHSAAGETAPERQGAWSMFEVFFDTMICCTLTAVTVMCGSAEYDIYGAVSTLLGSRGTAFLAAEMGIFALCTVTGWYYCGETAYRHLTKGRHIGKYTLLYAVIASSGAIIAAPTVWTVSDIFNGLMAVPNLLGIILLMAQI